MKSWLYFFCLALFAWSSTGTAQDFWQQTKGPVGGNVTALAVNAAGELFAGTAKGYLFRSADGGRSWTMLRFRGYSVNAIAFNAQGHLFVASEDRGVFRSVDNGRTWQVINNGFPPPTFGPRAIVVAPDGTLFCGTDYGIYRSRNNGDSWQRVGLADIPVFTLLMNSAGILFAGTQDAIFRSTDGGITWNQAHQLPQGTILRAMAVHPGGALFVGVEFFGMQGNRGGRVLRSLDDGVTWTAVLQTDRAVWSLAVSPAGRIFAGTENRVHYSDDGTTWQSLELSGGRVQTLSSSTAGRLLAGTKTDGVLYSDDDGATWSQSPLPAVDVRNLFITGNGDIYANGVDPGLDEFFGIFRSRDRGESWTLLDPPAPDAAAWIILAIGPENYLYASAVSALYRSTDAAQTWEKLADFEPSALGFSARGDLLAAIGVWGLSRSADGGLTWQSTSLNDMIILAFALTGNGTLFAGGLGGVYRSTDHGMNWTTVLSLETMVTALAVNSRDHIFAGTARFSSGVGTYTGGRLYRSTDGGQTWEQLPLPPATVSFILITPEDHLYVAAWHDPFAGTAGGIFFSADDGTTWSKVMSGLPAEDVLTLALSPDGYLFAGTEGAGVFRSVDRITAVESPEVNVPVAFRLYQNYPNPFNPGTTIRFALPKTGHVTLKIYNLLGQEVATLVDERLAAGEHRVTWQPHNLPGGVYLYRLQAGEYREVKKMVLMR